MLKASDVRPGTRVAALSLWEPWATLMAIGAKKNETRHWPTNHRGALLICAAQRKNKRELQELLAYGHGHFGAALKDEPMALAPSSTPALSYGNAVALVDLDECLSTDDYWPMAGDEGYSDDEFHFGNYSDGRFAWITSGLRRLKPFPVKGRQGLFYVTMPADFEDYPK